MGKFKARYVVVPLIIAGIVGGTGYYVYQKKQSEKVVNVVSIKEINNDFIVDERKVSYYGTPKKGSILNVKVDTDFEIEEVKVEKGDVVKKGDVLFTYDTHSLELTIEGFENDLNVADNKIKVAENELYILRRLQPLENAPEEEEEEPEEPESGDQPQNTEPAFEYSKKITKDTKPIGGSGTAEDPYLYIAGIDTVVTKDYLTSFADNKDLFTLLYVCSEDGTVLFGRLIESNSIDKENVSDWLCTEGVTIDPMGGISFDPNNTGFARVIVYPQPINVLELNQPSMPVDMPEFNPEDFYFEQPADNNDNNDNNSESTYYEISWDDNYKYPLEDLKEMIKAKEKEIDTIKLSKKQTEIDCRKAKQKLEDGSEVSTMDGTVTFVAKDTRHLSDSGAFITIVNSAGMSITCKIGEFSLNTIVLDMPVVIQNYEDNRTYQGRITEISDKPIASDDGDDWLQSTYEFIVTSNDEFTLSEENGVSVIPIENSDDGSSGSDNMFNIQMAFVREENGRYIAMVEGENGLLEKRILTVGETYYGFSIDIIDGLKPDDYLAIPYGRAVEGMPVKRVDYDQMYGGLFGLGIF